MKRFTICLLFAVSSIACFATEPPEIIIRTTDGIFEYCGTWSDFLLNTEPTEKWKAKYPTYRCPGDQIARFKGVMIHMPFTLVSPMDYHQWSDLQGRTNKSEAEEKRANTADFIHACSELKRRGYYVAVYIGASLTTEPRPDETESQWASRIYSELAPYRAIYPKIDRLFFDAEYEGKMAQILERLRFHDGINVGIEPAAKTFAKDYQTNTAVTLMDRYLNNFDNPAWVAKNQWVHPKEAEESILILDCRDIAKRGNGHDDADIWERIHANAGRLDSIALTVLQAPQGDEPE